MTVRSPCLAVAAVVLACGPPPPGATLRLSALEVAVEQRDVGAVRAMLDRGVAVDATDDNGDTALIRAAIMGDAELVSLLLAHHADAKHADRNGATALHFAIDDRAKTEALLAAGANPNAADNTGYTPLMTAANRGAGGEVVELLLDHGADPNHVADDEMTPLILAGGGDLRSVKALLAHGADPRAHTTAGFNALHAAVVIGNTEAARLLVERGADVNVKAGHGRTPLIEAAEQGRPELVQLLIAHGADVDARETFSATTAMMEAAASDRAEPAVIDALLSAGAKVSLRDDEDASAITWALRRGELELATAIKEHDPAHARDRNPVSRAEGDLVGPANTTRAALDRAIPLLERSRPAFRRRAGCPSCHHDALPAMAIARAGARGVTIDRDAQQTEVRATTTALRPHRDEYVEGEGFADIVEPAYLLVGLDASGYPRDDLTDAMTRYLELQQRDDGGWRTWMQRIPIDGSDVTLTALAIRAITRYAAPGRTADSAARVARARDYLVHAVATTTEDLTFKALGLHWSGATGDDFATTLATLAATQRDDGGFAQRSGLASDAYATGEAIVALRDAGGVAANDPAIARAVRFLLTTQRTDGSWFVATRALRFQPFLDSGFPQGRSQYSSAAGTAWAAMALAATTE